MSEKFHSLIVGSGNQGVEWSKNRSGVLCLDADRAFVKPHVYGDVFHLPFPSGGFQTVYVDFLFNSFVDSSAMLEDIESPDYELRRQMNIFSGAGGFRFMRYGDLLQELWRVVGSTGNLAIMDLDLNIRILDSLIRKMEGVESYQPVIITEDDVDRSVSLKQVQGQGLTVARLAIRKA